MMCYGLAKIKSNRDEKVVATTLSPEMVKSYRCNGEEHELA